MSKIKDNIEQKAEYDIETLGIENLNLIDNWDQKQFFYLRRNKKNMILRFV